MIFWKKSFNFKEKTGFLTNFIFDLLKLLKSTRLDEDENFLQIFNQMKLKNSSNATRCLSPEHLS